MADLNLRPASSNIRRFTVFSIGHGFVGAVVLAITLMWGFLLLNDLFPFPLPDTENKFATAVLAGDGTPMRTFPDDKGVWRYPVDVDDVSPLYLEALIHYEDRLFRLHPGINPWAIGRAFVQYLASGEPVSGGSTLTMQVARIFDPHSKTIAGKLRQMFRALQLECDFTKSEILTFYLNFAPFGGTVEGVQAASYTYLGKPADELSHAEAALLAVLPQAPTRLRPDLHPERAEKARNKVLKRLNKFDVWNSTVVSEAMMERVAFRAHHRPMTAPLLARRLKDRAAFDKPVRTAVDLSLQRVIEDMLKSYAASMPDRTSAAALVVENETMLVKAYAGSADFTDDSRFGHVDMIRASRSPGSTLKPFLYGFAIEEGLIHSESLLVDAPYSFGGYRPSNFTRMYAGPVSVSEALQRSLNLPAVDILDRLGPRFFCARMRQGGCRLELPTHEEPSLAVILGGVGIRLEDLTASFAAFGREGIRGELRFCPDDPMIERRLIDPGAAFIIRDILKELRRPDLPLGRLHISSSREAAWKTGTSYGARDAWCIGVAGSHTIGVWVGRPDGTSSPGQYGRAAAAPLLFRILDSLPRRHHPPPDIPENVKRVEICRPLGTRPRGDDDPLCHQRMTAWVLNDVVPPTPPDRMDQDWQGNTVTIRIDPKTGLRVEADCPATETISREIALWPKAARPWLPPRFKDASRIPKLHPNCGRPAASRPESVHILGLESDMVIRPPGAGSEFPTITLEAAGGTGKLFWLLDGELIRESDIAEPALYRFSRSGRRRLTVMDLAGNFDSMEFIVMAP